MSKEIEEIQEFLKADGIEVATESKPSQETSENPIEAMALTYGWRPEGKKSAEDYIKYALDNFPERGEALSKQAKAIENKDNELDKMKSVLDELSSHMKKQKDIAYQQALADIQSQRKQAIALGDADLVDHLDRAKANLQQDPNRLKPVEDFRQRHGTWLNDTSFEAIEMQEWVLERDDYLAKKGLPPAEHMELLERHLQAKFPNYFNRGGHVSAVDSMQNSNVAGSGGRKKNFTLNDLTKEQQEVAQYLDKSGHLKMADYIKQLVENGDLK